MSEGEPWLDIIADWIRKSLEQSGMSQAELSRCLTERLGRSIDGAAVNKLLKKAGDPGKRRALSADEMLAIAEITGCPPLASLEGEVAPLPESPGQSDAYLVKLLAAALEWRGIDDPGKARMLAAGLVGAARRHSERQGIDLTDAQARAIVAGLESGFEIPPPRKAP